MSRSIKKGPYVHPKLAKKVTRAQGSDAKIVIKTYFFWRVLESTCDQLDTVFTAVGLTLDDA